MAQGLQTFHEGSTYHANEYSVLLRRKGQRPSGLGRGCIYCWGHGNSAPIVVNDQYWNGIGRGPALAGIPTISADYGGQLWGNDTQSSRLDDAWTYLKAQGAATDKVFLLGISMGAIIALNWARTHLASVAAIALVTPGIDLANIHDVTRTDLAAEINSAYTDAAGYAAALPTHSPAQYAATLAGLPIRCWYSSNDPDVTPSTVTTFAATAGASTVNLGAVGHSAGAMLRSDVADWFAAYR